MPVRVGTARLHVLGRACLLMLACKCSVQRMLEVQAHSVQIPMGKACISTTVDPDTRLCLELQCVPSRAASHVAAIRRGVGPWVQQPFPGSTA